MTIIHLLTSLTCAIFSEKRQRAPRGSFDHEDELRYNWMSTFSHDASWAYSRKYKGEACKTQDEPLNSHVSTSVSSKLQTVDASWDVRSPVALRTDSNENYQPGSFHKHNFSVKLRIGCNTQLQKYEVDDEKRYMMQNEAFNTLPEAAIKTEQDSDSENGCNAYGMLWRPEYAQVKTEPEYYDYWSFYQKGKTNVSPYTNGHHKYLCAGVSRPRKCVLYKDLNHSDVPIGSQDGYMFTNDHKNNMQRLAYEFRSHNRLHVIKQEPDDSPVWCPDVSQVHMQQNIPANCTVSNVVHKANPYVHLQ